MMIECASQKSACAECSYEKFCFNKQSIKISGKEHYLKKNESLNLSEDKFKGLYVIREGALKAYKTDPDGNELIHGLYLKNEVYGYESIYKGEYFFSATALCETILCEISYPKFLDLLSSNSHLLDHLLHLMSHQLTFGAYLKSITAQQRLAAFILDLFSRLLIESSSLISFYLPLSYQDIGRYLGLATETISRIFSQLKKEKIISIENKCIQLLQIDKLKSIAEGFLIH